MILCPQAPTCTVKKNNHSQEKQPKKTKQTAILCILLRYEVPYESVLTSAARPRAGSIYAGFGTEHTGGDAVQQQEHVPCSAGYESVLTQGRVQETHASVDADGYVGGEAMAGSSAPMCVLQMPSNALASWCDQAPLCSGCLHQLPLALDQKRMLIANAFDHCPPACQMDRREWTCSRWVGY